MNLNKDLDAVVVENNLCPSCNKNPAGPVLRRYLCEPCTRDLVAAQQGPALNEAAKRELAERELCRRRFLPFVKRMVPNYMVGWFHVDLAARLERFSNRIADGESPRLIINVPPRHGKTEQASKGLVAWHLGRHPDHRFLSITHSDRLAVDNSRDVLRYMRDVKYQTVFPDVALDKDSKGAMGWRTTKGGIYKPAGVGTGIAGYGAHALLIDDPHRDQDAYSAAVREGIWQWYKSSARTRLMPGGGIALIQTRWVMDDMTGRLIDEEGLVDDGGAWELVCYPAQAEEDEYRLPSGRIVYGPEPRAKLLRSKGDYLHPERYGEEQLAEAKKDPVVWQALYQQRPTSGQAAQFSEDMFELSACKVADIPKALTPYTTWDTAQGQRQVNDWSVGLTAGVDSAGTIWVQHVHRERLKSDDLIAAILDNYEACSPELVGIENTQFVVGLKSSLETTIAERRLPGFPLRLMEHGNKDKVLRARPIQSRMRRGSVKIPTDAPWFEVFKKELLEFPGGRFDDQVDAFAYLGQLLEEMAGPASLAPPPKASWKDKLRVGGSRRSWRAA